MANVDLPDLKAIVESGPPVPAKETPAENIPEPKATGGKVALRKKTLIERAGEIFLKGTPEQARKSVFETVIVPGLVDMAYEAVTKFVGTLLYSDARPNRQPGQLPSTGYTSYGSFFNNAARAVANAVTQKPDKNQILYNFADIVVYDDPQSGISAKARANYIVDVMLQILEDYRQVRVAEFYEQVGWKIQNTDYDWGWTNLNGIRAVKTYDGGYRFILPPCQQLPKQGSIQ